MAFVSPGPGPEHMRDIIRGVKSALGDDSSRPLLEFADSGFGRHLQILEALTDALVVGAVVYPPPYARYAARQCPDIVQGVSSPWHRVSGRR